MLRKGNCKKIILNISKSTSHLWIILWIIMLYVYEIVFPGIRTIQCCHVWKLLTGGPAAAIVQSSKFIGRTFLLGNYNTLQLYPSDNILQYNKRVLKKQCNYHCFGEQKMFLCIRCTTTWIPSGSVINIIQNAVQSSLAALLSPGVDLCGPPEVMTSMRGRDRG